MALIATLKRCVPVAAALFALLSIPLAAQSPIKPGGKTCIPASDASPAPQAEDAGRAQNPNLNKDICVTAHVYALVELADGTRFLDVCPPEMPDLQCRFTLLSLPEDRGDVGDLTRFRDRDIVVRGILRTTHGRLGILISHQRQFQGGPEKFRPNPKLLRDFNGQSDRMPVRDPNLAPSGRHRSFMNTRDTEPLPQKH